MMAVLNFLFIFTIVLWEKPEKQTPETGRLLVRDCADGFCKNVKQIKTIISYGYVTYIYFQYRL